MPNVMKSNDIVVIPDPDLHFALASLGDTTKIHSLKLSVYQ